MKQKKEESKKRKLIKQILFNNYFNYNINFTF